jgi:hypothetical protein
MKTFGLFGLTTTALISISGLFLGCGSAPGSSVDSTDQASTAEECAVASDCTGFLPRSVEQCSDGTSAGASWSCVRKHCAIEYCSASPAPTNACSSASDCTGFLPRNVEQCSNGTSSGASWGCVEGACQIQYCVAPPANGCNSPSDCTGFLPRNVEECSDGSSSGASWGCVENQCTIQYCVGITATDGGSSGSDSDGGSSWASDGG